jgi:tripartite-type tricarboxylate transporter receptor subunit TctC
MLEKEALRMKKRVLFMVVLGLLVLLMAPIDSIAAAGKYPERPVECIVPWGVGGGSTIFARAMTQQAEKFLGQPIPIINIPGASGGVGLIEFMKKPADGYSITTVNTDTVIGSALGTYKHTIDELDFIIRAAISTTVIYVRKESPFTKFEELADFAKKNPDKLKFGGEGISSNEVLANVGLASAGVKTKYINYEGGTELMASVMRGETDLGGSELSQVLSLVDSGRLRILASASDKRWPGFPNLPTLKELGYDIDLPMLRGVAIKKGADPAIRKILEDVFTKAADSEPWKNFMTSKRLDPKAGYMNSRDFDKFIGANYVALKDLIKKTGYLAK